MADEDNRAFPCDYHEPKVAKIVKPHDVCHLTVDLQGLAFRSIVKYGATINIMKLDKTALEPNNKHFVCGIELTIRNFPFVCKHIHIEFLKLKQFQWV